MRPRIHRRIRFHPSVYYFKPRGIPMRMLEEVVLLPDELEALRLHDLKGLEHVSACKKMGISQPTFGRILNSAYQKISQAIIEGKAIRIEKRGHKGYS